MSATDKDFHLDLGDHNYVELFVQILSDLCLRHQNLQVEGLDFIRKMNILMKLLLEYREVINKELFEVFCTLFEISRNLILGSLL